jgi:hypothetical protein
LKNQNLNKSTLNFSQKSTESHNHGDDRRTFIKKAALATVAMASTNFLSFAV